MTQPDFQLYPDEHTKIAIAMTRLSNAFDFSSFSEKTKRIFDVAAREEFGRIGLVVHINWQEIYQKTGLDTDEPTGIWIPQIEPYARHTPESETDHDRMRYGIVKGLDGGEPGYIRADGSVSDEPLKKDIL